MPLQHPLSARFENLPLILCGPIVRRVEPEIVSVWVALKAPRQIELELYKDYHSPTASGFPGKIVAFKSQKTSTIKIGEHLHLALVTIETKIPFAPGTIYSYDLLFYEGASGNPASLISLGLLNDPVLLGFADKQLPSFIIPPEKLKDLRIAHGSCRKPHGRGRDGLATLAKTIKDDFSDPGRSNPQKRPHYFFHTGDQIYADDCSDYLIQHYTDAGNFLLQKVETLPFPKDPTLNYLKQGKTNADFVWIQATSDAFPPGRRATNFYSGFTGDQSNHLFSFAEFAAAYLFQWSDVLWPDNLPETEELYFDKLNHDSKFFQEQNTKEKTSAYLFPLIKEGDLDEDGEEEEKPQVPKNWDNIPVEPRRFELKNNENVKKAFEDFKKGRQKKVASDDPRQKELVEDFRKDLKAARRVLANMPSIMSFDDHDVTDDWYMSGRWAKQALGTRLGETIIRNGLLAFAFFQSWGNDPKGWADVATGKDDRSKLLKLIPDLINSFKPYDNTDPLVSAGAQTNTEELTKKFHELLGFDDLDKPPVKWHCFLKISEARVFVLDTRTRRDFSLGLDFPPNLIRKTALDEQIPDKALPAGTELAIVISGAPVLGLAAIESIGQPMVPRVLDSIRLLDDTTEQDYITKRDVPHKGNFSLDVEHWSINQQAYEVFLKRCATLKKVLFLAGDVHYGITSEMDYWVKAQPEAARFVQMVSSSLKNIKPEGQLMGILPSGITQAALGGGLNKEFTNIMSIGWENSADCDKVKLSAQTEPGKFRNATMSDSPLRISYAMAKRPILLTLRDWPLIEFGSKVLKRIVLRKDCPLPSFIWKMNVIADERPDNIRFSSFISKPANLTEDIKKGIHTGDAYEKGLGQILNRGAFYSRSHINRTVNWYSHVAIIDFVEKPGGIVTRQSIFFQPFLEGVDTEQSGTYDQPLHQYETSLTRKLLKEQPEFPSEKNP